MEDPPEGAFSTVEINGEFSKRSLALELVKEESEAVGALAFKLATREFKDERESNAGVPADPLLELL